MQWTLYTVLSGGWFIMCNIARVEYIMLFKFFLAILFYSPIIPKIIPKYYQN